MSREYSTKKIKEALAANKGNAANARNQVITIAMEDNRLLKELVKPHMIGIVAHAVDRVVSGKTDPEVLKTPEASEDEDSFGMDILKAIAGGDSAQFGQENFGRPVRKQGASQAHIDAIRKMISKTQSSD